MADGLKRELLESGSPTRSRPSNSGWKQYEPGTIMQVFGFDRLDDPEHGDHFKVDGELAYPLPRLHGTLPALLSLTAPA